MIDKLVNEFENIIEKTQPYFGFEDRRQITKELKKFLQTKIYEHGAVYHIDKIFFEELSLKDREEILKEAQYYNLRRIVQSVLDYKRTEELKENLTIKSFKGGEFKEHQLHTTLYVLKP